MEPPLLICKQCKWKGRPDEVDWDTVETCMGTDKIEVCPKCGSLEVYSLIGIVHSSSNIQPKTDAKKNSILKSPSNKWAFLTKDVRLFVSKHIKTFVYLYICT